jgi:hypothetical protein
MHGFVGKLTRWYCWYVGNAGATTQDRGTTYANKPESGRGESMLRDPKLLLHPEAVPWQS